MKKNRPSPAVKGAVEITHDRHGVFIGGDPEGLRSLASLLQWLADADQEIQKMPDGERMHVHLHPKIGNIGFDSLTEGSEETEVCRLDAKGTGELPLGPFRKKKR
jgi:hypothetical protein